MSKEIELSSDEITKIIEDFLDQIENDCQKNNRSSDPKEGNNNPKNRYSEDNSERYIPPIAEDLPPVILWGPPGVGKSSIIASICAKRNIGFVDVRLAQKDPVDMRGIPFPNLYNRTVDWYIASEWPTGLVMNDKNVKTSLKHSIDENNLKSISTDDGELKIAKKLDDPENRIKYGIIFFDELTAAEDNLQVAAYEMILDRKLGNEYKVPPGWYICAAGNRAEDKSVSKPMSAALANRFLHTVVIANRDSWLKWAKENGVHMFVTAFLETHPQPGYLHNMYDLPPLSSAASDQMATKRLQKGWPSPRSWERVSDCCKIYEHLITQVSMDTNLDFDAKAEKIDVLWGTLESLVKGLVGPTMGMIFVSDIKGTITVEKVLPLIEAFPIRLYYQDGQIRGEQDTGRSLKIRSSGDPIVYDLLDRNKEYASFAKDRLDYEAPLFSPLDYNKLGKVIDIPINTAKDQKIDIMAFNDKYDLQKYVNGVASVKATQRAYDAKAQTFKDVEIDLAVQGNDILTRFNNYMIEAKNAGKNGYLVETLLLSSFQYYLNNIIKNRATVTGKSLNVEDDYDFYVYRAFENLYFILCFSPSSQATSIHFNITSNSKKTKSQEALVRRFFVWNRIANLKAAMYKKIGKDARELIENAYAEFVKLKQASRTDATTTIAVGTSKEIEKNVVEEDC